MLLFQMSMSAPRPIELSEEDLSKKPIEDSKLINLRYEDALSATTRSMDYLTDRMQSVTWTKNWLFGPNVFDLCYAYRVRGGDQTQHDIVYGSDGRERNTQKDVALDLGIPDFDNQVPSAELRNLRFIGYEGRRNGINTEDHFLTAKHFPGEPLGKRGLESTEFRQVTFTEHLPDWSDNIQTFKDLLDSKEPPKAIMTSHASYPNLDLDIAEKYPDLVQNSILKPMVIDPDTQEPKKFLMPATLSPYMVKGFLKNELGYKGLAVSDWMDMGSIDRFLNNNSEHFPEELASASRRPKKIILGVDAGLNFMFGMKYNTNAYQTLNNSEINDIKLWAEENPQWVEKLDKTIQENLDWCKENVGALKDWEPPKVSDLSFKDKIYFFISYKPDNKQLQGAYKHVCTSELKGEKSINREFADLWNRQGILLLQMRLYALESITGKDYPRYEDAKSAPQWLGRLHSHESFWKDYNNIDWKSEETQQAWQEALEEVKKKSKTKFVSKQ